jgi:hypothetical protein
MEKIKFIKGQVYSSTYNKKDFFIWECSEDNRSQSCSRRMHFTEYPNIKRIQYKKGNSHAWHENVRLANPEELYYFSLEKKDITIAITYKNRYNSTPQYEIY